MADQPTKAMTLREAVLEMLDGKVMVDDGNWPYRFNPGYTFGAFEIFGAQNKWMSMGQLRVDGWRHATPEEIKLCSR